MKNFNFIDIPAQAFRRVIKYLYDDILPRDESLNMSEIYAVAKKLDLKDLKEFAKMEIMKECKFDDFKQDNLIAIVEKDAENDEDESLSDDMEYDYFFNSKEKNEKLSAYEQFVKSMGLNYKSPEKRHENSFNTQEIDDLNASYVKTQESIQSEEDLLLKTANDFYDLIESEDETDENFRAYVRSMARKDFDKKSDENDSDISKIDDLNDEDEQFEIIDENDLEKFNIADISADDEYFEAHK